MPEPSRRTIYVRDHALWQQVTAYAGQTGQSVSALAEQALRHYLTVLADHPDPAMRPRPREEA